MSVLGLRLRIERSIIVPSWFWGSLFGLNAAILIGFSFMGVLFCFEVGGGVVVRRKSIAGALFDLLYGECWNG
jgi:hypothetical protein